MFLHACSYLRLLSFFQGEPGESGEKGSVCSSNQVYPILKYWSFFSHNLVQKGKLSYMLASLRIK